jgi:hypothetical protein
MTRSRYGAMTRWRRKGFPWGKDAKLVVFHTFPKALLPLDHLYSATASKAQAIAWRCSAS